jgi:preprotein translocase subunit YajC
MSSLNSLIFAQATHGGATPGAPAQTPAQTTPPAQPGVEIPVSPAPTTPAATDATVIVNTTPGQPAATTITNGTTVPAPGPAASPQKPQGLWESLGPMLPLLLVFFVFWFFFIRPQSKQHKEIARRQSQLKNGDQVLTSAGIYGKVVGIEDVRVTLQVSEGTRIVFQRQAIVGFPDENKDGKGKR